MTEIVDIQQTKDGTSTLFHSGLGETYHSRFGALSESKHVFLKNGLLHLPQLSEIFVLEIGLGTGLNAWLTLQESENKGFKCYYTAIEPYPVDWEVLSRTSYAEWKDFAALHFCQANTEVHISQCFTFKKLYITLQDAAFEPDSFHLIYFDAFASQTELWQLPHLVRCFRWLKPGGIWVSYSAKGQLRRDLRTSGFMVENPPGAPGKKQMTRAIKPLSE